MWSFRAPRGHHVRSVLAEPAQRVHCSNVASGGRLTNNIFGPVTVEAFLSLRECQDKPVSVLRAPHTISAFAEVIRSVILSIRTTMLFFKLRAKSTSIAMLRCGWHCAWSFWACRGTADADRTSTKSTTTMSSWVRAPQRRFLD